jgi:hypothetical protein
MVRPWRIVPLVGVSPWAWTESSANANCRGVGCSRLYECSYGDCWLRGFVSPQFGAHSRHRFGRSLDPFRMLVSETVSPASSLSNSRRTNCAVCPPILAAIAWLALLARKRVRIEFLPPAIVRIYVNLLLDGPPSSRPTDALDLGNGLFELLPATGNDPEVEHWEFRPGSIVRGKEAHRDGETYLLAVSFGS